MGKQVSKNKRRLWNISKIWVARCTQEIKTRIAIRTRRISSPENWTYISEGN
jgi:hypothetical protein